MKGLKSKAGWPEIDGFKGLVKDVLGVKNFNPTSQLYKKMKGHWKADNAGVHALNEYFFCALCYMLLPAVCWNEKGTFVCYLGKKWLILSLLRKAVAFIITENSR